MKNRNYEYKGYCIVESRNWLNDFVIYYVNYGKVKPFVALSLEVCLNFIDNLGTKNETK